MTLGKPSAVVLLWIVACAFAVANYMLHRNDTLLGYDEGDYYHAVQRGFAANWTDADDISLGEFIATGIRAVRGEIPKSDLSRAARERNSTIFLRHYHPPLAYYPAIALQPFTEGLPLQEQLRLTNLVWMVLWISCMCALFAVYPEALTLWIVLLPASASYAMSLVGFNMHIPFGLMVSSLFFWWFIYTTSSAAHPWMRRLVLFFFAAALVSVAYGLFLSFFVVLWLLFGFVRSRDKKAFLGRRLRDFGWVALFLVLLWPASLLTLELPRAYMFQMYIALFRLPALESMFTSVWDMLLQKWNASPVELAGGAAVLLVLVYHWRQLVSRGSLFVSFGLVCATLYLQFNPTLVLPWYLFPVYAVMLVFYLPALFRLNILPSRWDSPLWAYTTAAVLFTTALVVVQPRPEDGSRKLYDIIQGHREERVVIPLSLYTRMTPYFPAVDFYRLHDTEFDRKGIADSIAVWRRRGPVIVPNRYAVHFAVPADDSTESYRVFYPVAGF